MEFEIILLIILLIVLRFFYLVHKITTGHTKTANIRRTSAVKTLICIGSGGHTTEMLTLINSLDLDKYSPRYYIMANNDHNSLNKVKHFEQNKNQPSKQYEIIKIPRSREVFQSFFTSVFTTLYAIACNIPVILKIRPELLICNGPGTCIPICLTAFVLRVFFIGHCRIVFIESFCRTKSFSLTGKILVYIADNILVQWPKLKNKLKRAEYIGQLI